MLMMGILIVLGSTASTFVTSIFPFDKYLGINASVAGVVFGVGMAIASFDPEGNLSWIRGGIMYAALLVAYQLVFGYFVGVALNWGPIVIGVVFAASLVALYPRAIDLIPTSRVAAAGESSWRN
jgi:hypothetical protein